MTLEELKAKPIYGNAYHDRELMNDIHQFIIDKNNSYDDRNQALLLLDKVMGFDPNESADADPKCAVEDYIRETALYTDYVDYFEQEVEPYL